MDLSDIDNFFFDLDSTLWNWNSTILGAEDLIHTLKEDGKKVRYYTDNTRFNSKGYADKLRSMDIDAEKQDILTVGHVAGRYFNRRDLHTVYVLGGSNLINSLDSQGVSVDQSSKNVLVGLDQRFSYKKLRQAASILEGGGQLFICSREKYLRRSDGRIPHQLALNNALKTFTDNTTLLGKPSAEYVNEFTNYFSFLADTSMLVGDSLDDIEIGNRLGMQTALVMSGDTTKLEIRNAEDIRKPDYGVSNLAKLTKRVRL